jgi:hypothetical protein
MEGISIGCGAVFDPPEAAANVGDSTVTDGRVAYCRRTRTASFLRLTFFPPPAPRGTRVRLCVPPPSLSQRIPHSRPASPRKTYGFLPILIYSCTPGQKRSGDRRDRNTLRRSVRVEAEGESADEVRKNASVKVSRLRVRGVRSSLLGESLPNLPKAPQRMSTIS